MADKDKARGRGRGRARAQTVDAVAQGRPGIDAPRQGGGPTAWGPPRGGPPRGGPSGQGGAPPSQAQWGPPPTRGAQQPPPAQPQGAWGNRPQQQQQAHQVRAPVPQVPPMISGRATHNVGGSGGPGGAPRSYEGQTAGGGAGEGDGTTHSARGGIRGRRPLVDTQILRTRPENMSNKCGTKGQPVRLTTNYFRLVNKPNWCLFQYRVDFAPDPDRTTVKKKLVRLASHNNLPAYIFDGTVLYTSNRLAPEPMELFADNEGSPVRISIRLVGDVAPGDYHYIQFFNIILRKCLDNLKLQLVGRNFYDAMAKIPLSEWKLELWPGYMTSIRQHEKEVLMCCEVTHKIMRMDTALELLQNKMQDSGDYQNYFSKEIIGCTVLTDYNNNTYRVDDVDWNTTPASSFPLKDGSQKRYIDYYREKYRINIRNMQQPLLISRAKARDVRAGMSETIYLVPELCRLTGLTESQRNNFQLMRSCAAHTRVNPANRSKKLVEFARRMRTEPKIIEDLKNWDLNLADKLVELSGRILPYENIVQGQNGQIKYPTDRNADWTRELRGKPLLSYGKMDSWVVIYPSRCGSSAQSFCQMVARAANGVQWNLPPPKRFEIRDDRIPTYLDALESVITQYNPSIILCIVSNNKNDRYSAIKKKCCVDRPVPTQVVLAKNLEAKGAMSIATKLMLQMNCKLGGAPWGVEMPLSGLMVVGFDVTHDTNNKSQSYGAMVASLDKNCTRYFADVSAHTTGVELSNQLALCIMKACKKYFDIHGAYPKKIIVYRDGVGDGQINHVIQHEVNQIEEKLKGSFYKNQELQLTFCIVSKRINTRFFANGENPVPGTVVDDVVTLPERYDFFIVSQCVKEGTVSPTSYNVIKDTIGLGPDRFQRLTYKFTHTYYNWSGTVRVPAPCQYAHKLAFLVGQALHRSPHPKLEDTLYFL